MELAEQVRREFGAQLPAAPVRESHADRDRRQEQTKFELETKVLPIVNEQRVASREPALTETQEDIVVELILSAMFLLPRLYGILATEPLAEDVLVFPGQPVRVIPGAAKPTPAPVVTPPVTVAPPPVSAIKTREKTAAADLRGREATPAAVVVTPQVSGSGGQLPNSAAD